MRKAGRGPLVTIGMLSVVTAASSVLFVASLKYAGVAVGSVLSVHRAGVRAPARRDVPGRAHRRGTVVGVLLALAGIVVLQL